jgi:hypothetical protein
MSTIHLGAEEIAGFVRTARASGRSEQRIGLELARDGLDVLDLPAGEAPVGVDPDSWELDRVIRAVAKRDDLTYAVALDKVTAATQEALAELPAGAPAVAPEPAGDVPPGMDPESHALDQKVQARLAQHPDEDYVTALDAIT